MCIRHAHRHMVNRIAIAFAGALIGLSPARAEVDWLPFSVDRDALTGGVLIAAILILLWAFFSVRRILRREQKGRQRVAELEGQLNDAEAALTAEPHMLIVWRERDGAPERIVGTMRGAAQVPEEASKLLAFETWLDPESAEAIASSIADMRESGKPFNIGVRTFANELVESVDGETTPCDAGRQNESPCPHHLIAVQKHFARRGVDTRDRTGYKNFCPQPLRLLQRTACELIA